MSNKKLDALRRLLLGSLYQECKDNPMGVSREKLTSHLQKLKDEGCIGDCTVDEFVKTCQLKSHYPTCIDGSNRVCVEGVGERSTGVDKFYYNQYKRAKEIEDESDTEDEESEEDEVCNICGEEEDYKGNMYDKMSCGHKSHISCLIKYFSVPTNRITLKPGDIDPETGEVLSSFKDIDNARCPECRKIFTFEEVPVPRRTPQQRLEDSERRNEFNASQMGFNLIQEDTTQSERNTADSLSERIINHINELELQRASSLIIDFYELSYVNNTSILSSYTKKWFDSILDMMMMQEGHYTDNDFRGLINTIFNRILIGVPVTVNHNFIKNLNMRFRGGRQTEEITHIIKSLTMNILAYDSALDYIKSYFELLLSNNMVSFLKITLDSVSRYNKEDIIKDVIREALDSIDTYRIKEETEELIKGWFSEHNYEVPEF